MRQLAHQGGSTVHCHKLRYPANDNKGFQSGPARRAVNRGSAVARSGGLLGGCQPAPPGGRDRPVRRTRVLRPHRTQPLCHRHRDLLVCRLLASATLTLGGGDLAQRVALAATLVVGAGVAFALAGFLRLGAMSNLIARPVLRGYAFGLALVIAVRQWPHLVGMHTQTADFLPLVAEMVRGTAAWQTPSLG